MEHLSLGVDRDGAGEVHSVGKDPRRGRKANACIIFSSPGLRRITGPVLSVLMPLGVEAGGSVSTGVPVCPSAPRLGMPCSFPEDTQGRGRESIVCSTQEMRMGQAMGQKNVSSACGSSRGGRWPGPSEGGGIVQGVVLGTHAVSQP